MSRRDLSLLCASVCLSGALAAGASASLWLDVPFIPQEKDGCGAASAAMVMQYWFKQQSKPVSAAAQAAEIQHALYSREAHGIRASDLERYFEAHGFRTFVFQGTQDDLKHHLEKGRPLIAALKPAGGILEKSTELHYVVVVGLDEVQDSRQAGVLLNDPAQRKLLRQSWPAFRKQWSAAGNWLLLALPEQQAH